MEWDKKPKVQETDFRSLIDGVFKEKKAEPEAPKAEKMLSAEELEGYLDEPVGVKPPGEEAEPVTRHKVKLPEPPQQTDEEKNFSVKKAKDELELIRQSFLEFTDKVGETVLYSYLYPDVEEFVEACKDMQTLINNDINLDELTDNGLKDYEKLSKIRARILSDVFEKHNRNKGE